LPPLRVAGDARRALTGVTGADVVVGFAEDGYATRFAGK